MDSIWTVILLALLPAFGNFGGGLLAEFTTPSKGMLNKALHASAGIVIAVVAIELMPEALSSISPWIIGVTFGLGGIAYVAIEALVEKLQSGKSKSRRVSSSMWMIYTAVSIDLFGDGLLIGAGSAVSLSMALVLALGQVLADVPEGYATVATMKDKGVARSRRLLLSAAFIAPVVGAAVVSYYLLRKPERGLSNGDAIVHCRASDRGGSGGYAERSS